MSGKHHEGQSHRESLSRRLRTQQRFMYAIHETRESAPGARTKPSNIIPRTKSYKTLQQRSAISPHNTEMRAKRPQESAQPLLLLIGALTPSEDRDQSEARVKKADGVGHQLYAHS